MIWQCALVGLFLVLPGTLLHVEGRYYGQPDTVDTALTREGNYLDTLRQYFKYIQKQRDNYEYDNNYLPDKKQGVDSKQTEIVQQNTIKMTTVSTNAPKPAEEIPEPKPFVEHEVNEAVQEAPVALAQSQGPHPSGSGVTNSVTSFIIIASACTVLAAIGIVGAGVCWYKYHRSVKAAGVAEYPAYGVTGPSKDRAPSPGDRKLAHSAQMYHYQHQKQQMMASMKSAGSTEMKHDGSDDDSGEDNDEADYTVYECPGLAPTGEMEVRNPLFRGDETPSTPATDDTHPSPPEY